MPKPETSEIQGEKEESPRTSLPQKRTYNAYETARASERMQALIAKKLGVRAIVCFDNAAVDATNPKNWGVVIDADPFSEFPLMVQFAGEKGIVRSNGEELKVIYPHMSRGEMAAYLQGKEKGFQ